MAAATSQPVAPSEDVLSQSLAEVSTRFEHFIAEPTFENAMGIFGPMLLSLGQAIIALLVLLIVVSFVSRWMQRLVKAGLTRAKVDATVTSFLARFAKYAVWLVAIPIAFELFGVRTTSLAAVIGAGGLAIGLAMQGALSNIAAGVMLLMLRPIRIGDYAEVNDEAGEVKELGIFYTTLTSWDNRVIYMPNSAVLGSKIENITGYETRRIEIPVGVAYGTDLERAKSVMLEALRRDVPARSRKEEPKVWLTAFGASSIDLEAHVWCPSRDYFKVRDEAILALNQALHEANIEIPFPQRTLTIAGHVPVMVNTSGA